MLGGGNDMAKRKRALPFDKRGGSIVIQRRMLESPQYLALSLPARCLLPLLQCHWRNEKPIDFGCRQAATLLNCTKDTAGRVFGELEAAGFIAKVEESHLDTFSGKGNRPRAWRLTWLPYLDKPPTNCWEKISAPVR